MARGTGVLALLERWPKMDCAQVWLATSDADSCVPPDWLTVQLDAHAAGVDLWAGRIRVAEESSTALRWTERYAEEPYPIHGASLGFSGTLYTELGGFRRLRSSEDRDFHHRAVAAGFRILHDPRATVTTSSRRKGRDRTVSRACWVPWNKRSSRRLPDDRSVGSGIRPLCYGTELGGRNGATIE